MKNKYLITGATGFIGANITRDLVRKGESVSIIVRDKKLNWRLSDISSKIDIYKSDILSPSLETIIDKIRPDYIFHLAAYGVMSSEDDTKKMTDVNIRGTIKLKRKSIRPTNVLKLVVSVNPNFKIQMSNQCPNERMSNFEL